MSLWRATAAATEIFSESAEVAKGILTRKSDALIAWGVSPGPSAPSNRAYLVWGGLFWGRVLMSTASWAGVMARVVKPAVLRVVRIAGQDLFLGRVAKGMVRACPMETRRDFL